MDALKQAFRPEFLNRIDEIIVFKRLEREQLRGGGGEDAPDLVGRLEERQISLELSDGAKDWLLERGYDEVYGRAPCAG